MPGKTLIPSAAAVAGVTGPSPTELPSVSGGLVTEAFSLQDVANGLSQSKLYRIIGGSAGVIAAQIPIRPVFRGAVVGITLQSSTAISTGSASIQVFVAGSASLALLWGAGTYGITTAAPGVHPVAPGDDIDVRITTSGFSPTTADIEVIVYLGQSSGGSES